MTAMQRPDSPSRGAPEAIGGEFVIPALAVAFAAYFIVSVRELAWDAKANAVVVAGTLMALVAIQLVRSFRRLARGQASLAMGSLIEPRALLPQRATLLAVTALFIALVPWLGLTLGLFCLVAALMFCLQAGSLRTTVLTALAVAAGAYVLFVALLDTRLPRGPVEALLAGLF